MSLAPTFTPTSVGKNVSPGPSMDPGVIAGIVIGFIVAIIIIAAAGIHFMYVYLHSSMFSFCLIIHNLFFLTFRPPQRFTPILT